MRLRWLVFVLFVIFIGTVIYGLYNIADSLAKMPKSPTELRVE